MELPALGGGSVGTIVNTAPKIAGMVFWDARRAVNRKDATPSRSSRAVLPSPRHEHAAQISPTANLSRVHNPLPPVYPCSDGRSWASLPHGPITCKTAKRETTRFGRKIVKK